MIDSRFGRDHEKRNGIEHLMHRPKIALAQGEWDVCIGIAKGGLTGNQILLNDRGLLSRQGRRGEEKREDAARNAWKFQYALYTILVCKFMQMLFLCKYQSRGITRVILEA